MPKVQLNYGSISKKENFSANKNCEILTEKINKIKNFDYYETVVSSTEQETIHLFEIEIRRNQSFLSGQRRQEIRDELERICERYRIAVYYYLQNQCKKYGNSKKRSR